MNPFDPSLDQPQTIDYDQLDTAEQTIQTNGEVHFYADRAGTLTDLFWAWHDRLYARSIRVRLSAPIYTSSGISTDPVDEMVPLVTRFYPGYQETIYGTEGVIVSKRLFAPLQSSYDRSVLWLLECQAEGHRLLRIEVEIDWGAPLEQRIVDGLLVAQKAPREASGLHEQKNAESTRVFGTAQGRPDSIQFPDKQRAILVYHVLVTGQVDLPLILTLSDVGEQVAWNGFLGLRDISRVFKISEDAWYRILHNGRLWTPHPPLNRAVQTGKIQAVQHLRRLRTGLAPVDRQVCRVPELVDSLDTCLPELSQALLAHLQKVAQKNEGTLPQTLPLLPKEAAALPGTALAATNSAYLQAMVHHLRHGADTKFLERHYPVLEACAEALVKARWQALAQADAGDDDRRQAAMGLRQAAALARHQGDSANQARWESEADEYLRLAGGPGAAAGSQAWQPTTALANLPTLLERESEALRSLAADAIWKGCGVERTAEGVRVRPLWPQEWGWWALLDLPVDEEPLSLLWDGEMLHATQFVQFDGPLALHASIRERGVSEDAFDLRFELAPPQKEESNEEGGEGSQGLFRPRFYTSASWRDRSPIQGTWLEGDRQ